MTGADHEHHSEGDQAEPGPAPFIEGPTEVTQTDNRPNECDPDEELPQDADWRPPEAGQ